MYCGIFLFFFLKSSRTFGQFYRLALQIGGRNTAVVHSQSEEAGGSATNWAASLASLHTCVEVRAKKISLPVLGLSGPRNTYGVSAHISPTGSDAAPFFPLSVCLWRNFFRVSVVLELLAISCQENNIKIDVNNSWDYLHPRVKCLQKLKYHFFFFGINKCLAKEGWWGLLKWKWTFQWLIWSSLGKALVCFTRQLLLFCFLLPPTPHPASSFRGF